MNPCARMAERHEATKKKPANTKPATELNGNQRRCLTRIAPIVNRQQAMANVPIKKVDERYGGRKKNWPSSIYASMVQKKKVSAICTRADGPSLRTRSFFPFMKLWVPRPCVLYKGGYDAADIMVCHACRPASHLRRSPSALYHQLVLPTPAVPRFGSGAQPLPRHSRRDAIKISLRSRGLRGHARTHSSSAQRAR